MITTPSQLRRPLPWTRAAWDVLWRARGLGRVPHALMICGPAGVGKRLFVTALIDALLCVDPGPDGLACGKCQDCHLLSVGTHPDCLSVGPDPDSKSSEIKVDSIRRLIDSEALTPHRGQYKIVVIDPAHQLNRAAANSLLKTLEEPAPTTLLVLISEEPNRLPATIRSRCLRLLLSAPQETEALEWLASRVSEADPKLLLRLAHGAPLRALELQDAALLAHREDLFTGFEGVLRGLRDPVAEAGVWIASEPRLSCDWLGGWLSDLVRLAVDPRCPYLANPDKQSVLLGLTRGLDLAAVHRYLQRILRARALVDTTINKQLLFESLLIELTQLNPEIA